MAKGVCRERSLLIERMPLTGSGSPEYLVKRHLAVPSKPVEPSGRFRVRETSDWKQHAGNLEAEMFKRGMFFDIIDWSEDQGRLPL